MLEQSWQVWAGLSLTAASIVQAACKACQPGLIFTMQSAGIQLQGTQVSMEGTSFHQHAAGRAPASDSASRQERTLP